MDADDIALPDRLKEQVEFMEQHPQVGVLGGAFDLINTSGRVLKTVRFPSEDSTLRSIILVDNPICHPAVVMRKDVVLASGGYRKVLIDADDYDLWLRISERSQLANLQQCVLRYRISFQSGLSPKYAQSEDVRLGRARCRTRKEGGACGYRCRTSRR